MQALSQIKDLVTARSLFIFLIGLVFLLLPILSLDAGISGDEPVHYEQAHFVDEYFISDSNNKSALNTPVTNLKYYGQVLDNLTYFINSRLHITKPYQSRHFINALCGALIILFSSLIAVSIGGYRAGILSILFLFLSPRFLGHSLNNLKDIPFALGYIVSIWGILKSILVYPLIKFKYLLGISLGLALAFGTRAGGLVIIPMIYLFATAKWLLNHIQSKSNNPQSLKKNLWFFTLLSLALICGYFIALLYWPYGRLSVFNNPLKALNIMTHYNVSIRQIFEGKWYWSENLPWYYPLKYILISTPVIILAGFVLQFKVFSQKHFLPVIILNFIILFPLLWVIIKASNLYGGWRHLLFIYPPVSIIAALSWSEWLSVKNKRIRVIYILLIAGGLSGPLLHITRNHPVEYVYFNYPSGGIKAAEGRYEMDYYFHSLGEATQWIKKYLDDNHPGEKIKLASNFDLLPYFSDSKNITTHYINYYTRGKADWDYGIFVSNYLYPQQLQNHGWPPKNTIHTINVSGIAVCAIIKRTTKEDLEGYNSYIKGDYLQSIAHFEKALKEDPDNELSLLYRAWAYRQIAEYEISDSLARVLLDKIPDYDGALDLLGRNQLSRKQYLQSLSFFRRILSSNYKYLPAYTQASAAYDSLGQYSEASQMAERAFSLGQRDSSTVSGIIRLLELSGKHEKTRQYRIILNKK